MIGKSYEAMLFFLRACYTQHFRKHAMQESLNGLRLERIDNLAALADEYDAPTVLSMCDLALKEKMEHAGDGLIADLDILRSYVRVAARHRHRGCDHLGHAIRLQCLRVVFPRYIHAGDATVNAGIKTRQYSGDVRFDLFLKLIDAMSDCTHIPALHS